MWSLPWCVAGDFNVVRSPLERSTSGLWTPAMRFFSEFIIDRQLIDLPLEGAVFTWSSGREMSTFSRLDRFLISGEWKEQFSDAVQAVLARVTSDHIPLVLDCRGKLHNLKDKLKRWNKEVFGNLEWRKNKALVDIAEFDRLDASGGLAELQCNKRVACQAECAEIAVMEEISWRQKSLALWLKEGDRNIKFFTERLMLIGRRLYIEPLRWRPRLDDLHFDSISVEDRDGLERSFMEEEVLEALKSCNSDKAPGPDGFIMSFLLESWEVVRQEIMAKVLASRLKGVLDGVISESQNAFIWGRQIMDFSLIASECVDFRLRSGAFRVLCKLDIEKAYDRVCWNFLFYLLERMGFGERWRKWIVTYVSSIRFSVLVNGSPSMFFWQLSWFEGFKISPEAVHQLEISHLLFVDDTLAISSLRINVGKSVLVPVGEIPSSVVRRLEMIQHNFLWGDRGEEFKYHLIRWKHICRPFKSGGLGIWRLAPFNRVLLGKWLWRFGSERYRLWRKIIACLFGEERGGWFARLARSAIGVGVWHSIRMGWEDLWCEECTLCRRFPRLFRISVDSHALVADCYRLDSCRLSWDVQFQRAFQDWELDDVFGLLDLLYRQEVDGTGADLLTWVPSSQGTF
ncbi:uncharacterized protein LOC132304600 [Cornus florida]|uniref:uncharacterized protein LOC132304600 n=1 Tax=Cornus florida TaxID=4283 RepID=UPI00289BC0E6|nr:uncharacterized protein LOC132304600 [Cornus florida]